MTGPADDPKRAAEIAALELIIANYDREIAAALKSLGIQQRDLDEAKQARSALLKKLNRLAPATSRPIVGDNEPPRPKRGDVKREVLLAIANRPGCTSDEVVDHLIERIDSPAKDRRKLIHSTISYLIHKAKLVRRDDAGHLYAIDRDPIRSDEDDDDLPF